MSRGRPSKHRIQIALCLCGFPSAAVTDPPHGAELLAVKLSELSGPGEADIRTMAARAKAIGKAVVVYWKRGGGLTAVWLSGEHVFIAKGTRTLERAMFDLAGTAGVEVMPREWLP